MVEVFRPIRTTLSGHGLGDEEVIAILNARVHTDRKK
jgi:hypothetical protein